MSPARYKVLDISVNGYGSFETVIDHIASILEAGKSSYSVAINAEKIMAARRNNQLREAIEKAEVTFADGIGACWAVKKLYDCKIPRLPGVELMQQLLLYATKVNWDVYFLGAKPEAIEKAVTEILSKYKGLKIIGYHHGYFQNEEEIIKQITMKPPELLFIGLGSPKQEYWMAKNYRKFNGTFCVGVGGSFDVIAGEVKRAPSFFANNGLEWLYRLFKQPSRWRRQKVLPVFWGLIMKEKFLHGQE